MPNVVTGAPSVSVTFPRLAARAWQEPRAPSIHVIWDLPADRVTPYLRDLSRDGVKIDVVHFFSRVLAHGLARYPDLNAALVRGSLRRRDRVNLFFRTLVRGPVGFDLGGFTIEDANRLTLLELAALHRERSAAAGRGTGVDGSRLCRLIAATPAPLLAPAVRLADFALNTLNLDLSGFGIPRDPFGSAVIATPATTGADGQRAPLLPMARCGYGFSVRLVRRQPAANRPGAEAVRVCRVDLVADHRYLDGVHVATAMRLVRRMFCEPLRYRSVFE